MFFFLNGAWNLGIERIMDIEQSGVKGWGALFISMAVGLIGLSIGLLIGGLIRVKSDNLAAHITVAWHYLANTVIYWSFASMFAAGVTLGNYSDYFFRRYADSFFITGLILSIFGSQLILWVNFFSARMIIRGNHLGVLIIKLFPIFVGFMMAIVHFGIYGINSKIGIVAGILLPFIIIPVSGKMWRKDMLFRNPYLQF